MTDDIDSVVCDASHLAMIENATLNLSKAFAELNICVTLLCKRTRGRNNSNNSSKPSKKTMRKYKS